MARPRPVIITATDGPAMTNLLTRPPRPLAGGNASATPSQLVLCARIFWAWVALRTIGWTLLATLVQPNGALDLIEWLSWGHQWQLGYHKHPPFPAWVAAACHRLTPGSLAGVYFASYLTIGFCLWCGWRLGRELVGPRLALFGVLALDGLTYFTFDAAEFNNNVMLNAFWSSTILCVYLGVRTDRMRWWIGLGVSVGLGLLTKYTLAFLLVPLVALTLLRPEARVIWRRKGVYVAAAVALALFAPHLWWLWREDFVTLGYAKDRSTGVARWWAHLYYPMLFVSSQAYRLVMIALPLLPLLARKRNPATSQRAFDQTFLAWAVVAPVVLLVAVSVAFGSQLLEIWGSPLWTFAGIFLLFHLARDASAADFAKARRIWLGLAAAVVAFAVGKQLFHAHLFKRPMRTEFPGRLVAEEITRRWDEKYPQPFPVAAGECWIAGNVAVYAPHRPAVYPSRGLGYLDLEEKYIRWTNNEDVRRRGGVLVWPADKYGDDLPAHWRELFPTAEVQEPLVVPYQSWKQLPPARVGVAFVPPARDR